MPNHIAMRASELSVSVPAGTHASIEARIHALRTDEDRGNGARAFLAAHPDLSGVRVIVTGTCNGQSFTYTGAPRGELESSFSPPLAVDGAPVNLVASADVTSWFKARSGTVIDPATANPGGANASVVADIIRRSLGAFRDSDRNGHDDDDRPHT